MVIFSLDYLFQQCVSFNLKTFDKYATYVYLVGPTFENYISCKLNAKQVIIGIVLKDAQSLLLHTLNHINICGHYCSVEKETTILISLRKMQKPVHKTFAVARVSFSREKEIHIRLKRTKQDVVKRLKRS